MARYDFNAQRLFVEADLAEGATVTCSPEQANYLRNVLRLGAGDQILVFNGRDGEWQAELAEAGKRGATLAVRHRKRVRRRPAPTSTTCSPPSSARGSTTWCRRRPRWAPPACALS